MSIIVHLSVGTTEDGRVVASCAPRIQLAKTEADVGTVAVTYPRCRPDGDGPQRWKRHTRREPKYDGRPAVERLL